MATGGWPMLRAALQFPCYRPVLGPPGLGGTVSQAGGQTGRCRGCQTAQGWRQAPGRRWAVVRRGGWREHRTPRCLGGWLQAYIHSVRVHNKHNKCELQQAGRAMCILPVLQHSMIPRGLCILVTLKTPEILNVFLIEAILSKPGDVGSKVDAHPNMSNHESFSPAMLPSIWLLDRLTSLI
jgi:hypothetical protein